MAARVRRWLSGPGAHQWAPRGLTVMLAGGACAPLLLSGQADPGLAVLATATAASVGGNVVSEVLTGWVGQLRDHPGETVTEDAQDWVEERFTEVLETGGHRAAVLEAELVLLLDRVGAGPAAVAEAARLGHEETARQMRAWLAQVDGSLAEVVSRLEDLRSAAGDMRQDLRLLLDRVIPPDPPPAAGPAGWLLAEVTSPFDFGLEVHRAIDLADGGATELAELPAYLERGHDRELAVLAGAAAEGASGIAVLVGGSSTGKTRACWQALEALRRRPEKWRLWHPIDPSRADAALREMARIGPRTVVWLNEAQFYLLGGTGEQVAAGLRELLRDPGRGPVLVLATLWPGYWNELVRRPAGAADPHAQARELLTGRGITVPPALTGAELEAAAATGDPRLAQAAAAAAEGRVIQFLAGAPELVERYDKAEPAARALLDAAVDARRLGMGPALPRGFLEEAAPGYIPDADWDTLPENWLDTALEDTGKPAKGIRGPLAAGRPHPGAPAETAYRLADYLEQHGRRARRACFPPDEFWAAAARHASPGDLPALADAAANRGLLRHAARLRKHAIRQGDPRAAADLVWQLYALHPADVRPAQWATARVSVDGPGYVGYLLDVLRAAGAEEQAAALAARAVGHVALDNPLDVADLLRAVRVAGVEAAALAALAARAVGHVALDNPGDVADLLRALRGEGAEEQAAALAARAAAHVALDNPRDIADLLDALRDAGAQEQAAALAGRAAGHVALDNPGDFGGLLYVLRVAGVEEQAAALAARAAAHVALDNPRDVADLMRALRFAGAEEQAAALAARDPAGHVALDNPRDIVDLLLDLRFAGAEEQAAALAARAAAHVALDNPRDLIVYLLHVLRDAGAEEQAAALIAQMPAEGQFDLFLEQAGHQRNYGFGREPDGSPAPGWGWNDLDD